MKIRIIFLFLIVLTLGSLTSISAQVNSVIGQITSSGNQSFAGGISGNGRFVVFESDGNLATENPRNSDGNREIFIFDYAQRRIFQITDTKSLLNDTTVAPGILNTKVLVDNNRPTISNDGRWIAFSSNATTSTPAAPDNTNPGNFDANSFTSSAGANVLTTDGNTEMWLYQVPAAPSVDLTSGAEIPLTNLTGGSFIRVTNTAASRLPIPASETRLFPFIADDNHDASINDDGNVISFGSTRDLVSSVGNASPDDNDEIFTYIRSSNTLSQITKTTRGSASNPIYAADSTISGNGQRVSFFSNADNPIVGMTGGANSDNNFEVFYADLNANGTPAAAKIQITKTARVNPGDIVNILSFGRRMSRDGRYIAFDSYGDLANENGGSNQTSFALYLYDTANGSFRRVGPRSTADTLAIGGDVVHYPGFSDYDANGVAQTLIFESRLNFTGDGTAVSANDSGLNPDSQRPTQIYSVPINPIDVAAISRLTKLSVGINPFTGDPISASTQPIPSNSSTRIAFNLPFVEVGTFNPNLAASQAYYLLVPPVSSETTQALSYSTGASRLQVSQSPVPTPTASPSPTPQTPAAVQGLSPGMLAFVNYDVNSNPQVTPQTAVGSLGRRFTLPIQLSGVTMTINGAACGLKSVGNGEILFVIPRAINLNSTADTVYSVVININGKVTKDTITIVPTRPDIFLLSGIPMPNGRARIFNATNRVLTREPFTVTTIRRKGARRVQTVLRLFLTGVEGVPASFINIRIGNTELPISQIASDAVLREPGVYSVDFTLPDTFDKAGDVPIILSITVGGATYQTRLDDTAPQFRIL